MKRQIVLSAALLAGLLLFAGVSDAQAFHFMHNRGCGCETSCCAPEPSCCEAPCRKHGRLFGHKHRGCCAPACESTCAAEPTCCAKAEPTCAAAPSCCEPTCCGKKRHFGGLFHRNKCCKNDCGCEATCAAEPTCNAAPSCCEPTCCGKKRHFAGLFSHFKKCCKNDCGCEATCAAEPTCGCR